MTQDEIIRMAREAGFVVQIHGECFGHATLEHRFNPDRLERFANLVAAHEREALAEPVAWKRESNGALFRFEVHEGLTPLYAPSVSVEAEWIETNKALAKEIIEQRNQYLDKLAEAVDLSVKAEREACAKVCEENGKEPDDHKTYEGYEEGYQDGSNNCAAAIRARSTT